MHGHYCLETANADTTAFVIHLKAFSLLVQCHTGDCLLFLHFVCRLKRFGVTSGQHSLHMPDFILLMLAQHASSFPRDGCCWPSQAVLLPILVFPPQLVAANATRSSLELNPKSQSYTTAMLTMLSTRQQTSKQCPHLRKKTNKRRRCNSFIEWNGLEWG